jgi:hypothetical protein
MPRINQIQVRRDTAANWTSVDPVLAAGEMGLETDTRKTKFGDGTTSWTSLAYATSAGLISSDTAPDSPSVGAQWFNSSTGKTYVYYDGYWVELDSNGTSATSQGNAIINGAFDIWQRGTSFTNPASGSYTADRFRHGNSGTGGTLAITREAFTPGAAPVEGYESAFYYRYSWSVASTGATFHTILGQNIEDVRTFAGQTVTLSFWAKADASRSIRPILIQRFGSGGSSNVTTDTTSNVDLTTSWTRYTRTFTLPSIVGKTIGDNNSLGLNLASQSLNATQTIDIWGVQLEAGSVATPFKRNANSIQGELAACQRYYRQNYFDIRLSGVAGQQYSFSATALPMRVPPTAAFTAAADYSQNISGTPSVFVPSNSAPTVSLRFGAAANGDLYYGRPYELVAEL